MDDVANPNPAYTSDRADTNLEIYPVAIYHDGSNDGVIIPRATRLDPTSIHEADFAATTFGAIDVAVIPIPTNPSADIDGAVIPDATADAAVMRRSPISINARAVITTSAVRTDDVRSPRFYYEDGDMIIRVQNTLYKLERGRLAGVCDGFADIFEPSPNGGWMSWVWSFIKSPVYEIVGIHPGDFERFLETVMKFDHIAELSTREVYISLLRVAHALKSETIFGIAQHRLRVLSVLPDPDDPAEEQALRNLLIAPKEERSDISRVTSGQ